MLTQTNMLARWSRKRWQPMYHFQLGSQQGIPSALSQKSVNLPRRGAAFSKRIVRDQMRTCHWAWSHHRNPAAPHSQLTTLPSLSTGSTGKHALAHYTLAEIKFPSLVGCRAHKALQPITFYISQDASDEPVSNLGELWVDRQYWQGPQHRFPLVGGV